MTVGDKLAKLRKENNYTQEQLADILGVSRQSISKWESNISYPETEKLIRISELFHCSLDYLLKDEMDTDGIFNSRKGMFVYHYRTNIPERKSKKMVWGMPLWHIGKRARGFIAIGINAKGVIALGMKAEGVISLGLLSVGILSFGLLSLGVVSLGMLALGILSAGSICAGIFTAGAISLGIVSMGAIAVGDFSVGALAIGKYFSMGDSAQAMIAIGDTEATGSVFQKTGDLTKEDVVAVKRALDMVVPSYLSWAKGIIKAFIK